MADDYLSTLFASKPPADPSDPTGEFAAGTAAGEGPGTQVAEKERPKIEPLPKVESTPKVEPAPTVEPTPKVAATPWLDRGVGAHQTGVATTFASPGDIRAYQEAKRQGKTEEQALRVGDNGVGSPDLGSIATPKAFGVAVPESKLTEIFGYDPEAWRKARAVIIVGDHQVVVPIVDLGPGETAKARGVVTDYTDPLAKALGAKGYDQTNITIIKNAGPDYMTDREGWDGEQARIKKSLGISEPWLDAKTQPANKTPPWLDNAVTKPQSDKPWLGATVTNHPVAKANGLDVGGFITGMWDTAKLADAKRTYGEVRSNVTQPAGPNDPYEQQIKDIQISPDYTDEQKQTIIQQLRDKQTQEKEAWRAKVPQAEAGVKEAEKKFQQDHPGKWSQIFGTALPYLKYSVAGPMAPFLAAQEATAETYGEVFDAQNTKLKKIHPDWSDDKILEESIAAASESARASGVANLALGLVDIPTAGPLISRIVKKIGLGAATMEIANVYAQAQRNISMNVHGDYNKDVLEGLRDLDFHTTNLVTGGAFALPHALGEIGRPSTKSVEERASRARQDVDAAEEAKVKPGGAATTVDDNGEIIRDIGAEVISVEPVRKQIGAGVRLLEDRPKDPITDKLSLLKLPDNKVTRAIATRALRADEGEEAMVVSAVKDLRTGEVVTNERGHQLAMRQLYPTASAKPDYVEYGYLTNTGRFVTSPMDLARQKEAEEVATHVVMRPGETKPQGDPIQQKLDLLKLPDNKVTRAISRIALRNDSAGVDKPVAAAIKYKDEIFTGQSHAEASSAFLKKYRGTDYDKEEFHEGFITNSGKFEGRWGGRDYRLGSPDLKTKLADELKKELEGEPKPVPFEYAAAGIKEPSPIAELGIPVEPERITGVAVKRAGVVATGVNHADAEEKLIKMLEENPPPDLAKYRSYSNGFMTSTGRFVDRYEASRIAKKAKQGLAETSLGGVEGGGGVFDPGAAPPPGGRPPAPPGREDLTPSGEIPEHEVTRGLDLPGSQFVIPMREVIENAPHTEELVRAIDEYRAILSDLLGQHAVLDQRLKQLLKLNPDLDRGAVGGRRGEVDYLGFYVEQNGKLPDKISPEAEEWLKKANQGLYRKIADLARSIGMKVFNPVTGKWEPFRGAPADVVPFKRRMRPDVQNLLAGKLLKRPVVGRPLTRDDLVPAAQELYDEGLVTIDKNTGEPFFSKPEDLLEWGRHYNNEKQHHSLASIERKRVAKYPTFFYTYSPEAMMDSIYWQAHEIARILAFGQRTDVDRDLFQVTSEAIDKDMSMTPGHKRRSLEAIQALSDDVYGLVKRGEGTRLMAGLTSRLAASPHTSMKIMVSIPGMGAPYTGVVNELRGALRSIFNRPDAMAEIRREGLASDLPLTIYDDPYTARSRLKGIQRFFSGELRAALHSFVYDQGRMMTYHAARLRAEEAIRAFRRDPTLRGAKAKWYKNLIENTGVDYREFLRAEVPEEVKRRFARELTNDVQTSYRHEGYPSWWNQHPIMVKFGHWTYDAASALTRYIMLPMAKAVAKGDWPLAGRYAAQLFGTFAAMSIASSEAWRWIDETFFGRQNHVATLGEILKRLYQHDPEAFAMVQDRLIQDITGSPLLGVFGDAWNVITGIAHGEVDTVHTFNPFIPPTVSMMGSLAQFISHMAKQGGKLSDKQMWDLTYQWATIVRGYYDLAENVASKVGIALPGHAEAEGRREWQFVRNRVDLFYKLHPEAPGKPEHGFGISTPHTPYLQNLQEALLSGNVQRAKDEVHRYHIEQKLTDKQLKQSVEASVRDHKPIPPGKEGQAFVHWARKAMPDDEWNRMIKIEKKYMKTAQEAGIPVHE